MLRRHFIESSDSNNGIIKITYTADSQQFFCAEGSEIEKGDILQNATNIQENYYDLNEYIFLKEDYDTNSKMGNWYFKCKTSSTIATGFTKKDDIYKFSTFLVKNNSTGAPREFTMLEISEGVENIKAGYGITALFGLTNENLSTLILPQSLKYIEDAAFFGFTNITNVIGGDNLEYITNMQPINGIPIQVFGTGFVESLYMRTDQYSKGKVLFKVKMEPNVKVPEGFNQYYPTLFIGGEETIETIELPNNFIEIYPQMCMGLLKLNTVDLSNVTSIGDQAFGGCTNLKYVDLSNVTNIGDQAFEGSGIEEFTINDDKIENIGNACFKNCTNLKMAIIPSYWTEFITTTGNMSMYNNCRNIETVYFNAKKASIMVKTSYGYLYQSSNTIKTVIIGEHVTKIPRRSFYKCALENITYKGTIEQWNLILKDTGWYGDAVTTVVHCTDGDVELERI